MKYHVQILKTTISKIRVVIKCSYELENVYLKNRFSIVFIYYAEILFYSSFTNWNTSIIIISGETRPTGLKSQKGTSIPYLQLSQLQEIN